MQQENLFEAAKKAFFSSDPHASPLERMADCVATPGSIEAFLQKSCANPGQAAQTKPVPFAQVPKQAKAKADVQTPLQMSVTVNAKSTVHAGEHELVTVGHKK